MDKEPNGAILLVAHSATQRMTDSEILRESGYGDLRVASNGTEAWSVIKTFDIDMVVCDWRLTEMNGLALLKVVRADADHAHIPFLLVLEEATRKQVIEAGSAGVTDILVRPFSRDVFLRKIEKSRRGDEDPRAVESDNLMKQGGELMRQGKLEEALSIFNRVLSTQESAEVYYNLGYIKSVQGRFEEAIAAFRRATRINNTFVRAYRMMGEVFAKMGRPEEAQRCFDQAADIYMERNENDMAEDVYMRALEINPHTMNVYNSLGILYRRQGDLQKAIRMYNKALRVSPLDENIHYNLARVHIAAKEFDQAREVLKKSLGLNPEFEEAAQLLRSIDMGEGLK